MMISLNYRQLDIVMTAAGALDPKKRDGCTAIGDGVSENNHFASKRPNRSHLCVTDCYCLVVRQLSTAPAQI
jgi:hypothetical protein